MSITDYNTNPALRPTVLVHEVMKNVYRPSETPAPRAGSDEPAAPRESSRAA